MSIKISHSPNGLVSHLLQLMLYKNDRILEFTIQRPQVRDRPGDLEIDKEWDLEVCNECGP